MTAFYKETYNNYKNTKQEALKETLRAIHFGVRTQNMLFFFVVVAITINIKQTYIILKWVSFKLQSSIFLSFVSNLHYNSSHYTKRG